MNKIKIDHLDIPIIRSCNLACVGCLTHSNHKSVKGLVRIEDSVEWLTYWSTKIQPGAITLFGGEPLLHPQFVEWTEAVKKIWNCNISFNSNGYYLDKLFPDIDRIFNLDVGLSMVITLQTTEEPYYSTVKNNLENLKQKIVEYHLSQPGVTSADWDLWLDETDTNQKKWYRLRVNGQSTVIGLTICEQFNLPWCIHYTGYGNDMRPVYDYNYSINYIPNYKLCQTKKFITLFKGEIFKCPPLGVLEHTLTTFNLLDHPDWKPYIKDYKRLTTSASDEEIVEWFKEQKIAQLVCNMCGFYGEKADTITSESRDHWFKKHWKITPADN